LDVITQDGNYHVHDYRLRVATSRNLYEQIKLAEEYGAGEILIQSVDRDGTRSEPDYELVEKLASVISVPLVYAGGVSSLDDAAKLWGLGVDGVAAGSWFIFRGRLRAVMVNYPDRDIIDARLEL
jgi:cyclase